MRRSSQDSRPPAAKAGVDDDTISLTSTISDSHDTEDEFTVEAILAEKSDDGEMSYLVEWDGFPLHKCTWEPTSHLGSELMEIWEETKEKHARGEEEPFDTRLYDDAVERENLASRNRHFRRNAKRIRIGLLPTKPFSVVDNDDDDGGGGGGGEAEEISYADTMSIEEGQATSTAMKVRTNSVPKPPRPQNLSLIHI